MSAPHSRLYARVLRLKHGSWLLQQGGCRLTDAEIVEIVKKLLVPMFELFDFMKLGDSVYKDIVLNYINSRAT